MRIKNKINFNRSRGYRRRSSSAPSRSQRDLKKIPSPAKVSQLKRKSPQVDIPPPIAKKSGDPDDIAELERRVLEAKKVLEVMVKEKLKEKRRSSSRSSSERRKRSKKSSRKAKRSGSD